MTEVLIVKLLHLLGFVYWLGGDLGVFYASFPVANDKLGTETRVVTAKMLFTLDQIPRMCMTMMLPLGIHLTWRLGILPVSSETMMFVWLIGFAWLAMVIFLHIGDAGDLKRHVARIDSVFRLLLSTGLVLTGLASLSIGTPLLPYWLALKLLIFGVLIGIGLILRIKLRPFEPAFANMASGNASDKDNTAISDALGGARPFVIAIWIGLVTSAALGIHLI